MRQNGRHEDESERIVESPRDSAKGQINARYETRSLFVVFSS